MGTGAWLYLTLLGCVVLLWLWINAVTLYRKRWCETLHPCDASTDTPQIERAGPVSFYELDETPFGVDVDRAPPVAILTPARDEVAQLPRTLRHLCNQDYAAYRVVFIDDESDDATPQVARAYANRYAHFTVVRNNDPPPPGWVGKCWALHRGYEHLKMIEQQEEESDSPLAPNPAQWICFTDADIEWDHRCLRSAMMLAEYRRADVVALGPRFLFGAPSEAIVQLQLMLAMGMLLPLNKAMDPNHPDTLTGGAFILVRRSLYDRIGGHTAVRDRVLDDINLGRALKAAGGRVRVAMAPNLLSTRMYESWPQMWEGLTKNAYPALEYRPHVALGLAALTLTANVLPPVYLLASLAWCIVSPSWVAGAAVGLSALSVLLPVPVMNVMCRLMELPARYAWSMPIGAAIYFWILLASMWRYYRGGNIWKGRTYGHANLMIMDPGPGIRGQAQGIRATR